MKRIIICISLFFISGCVYLGYLKDPFVDIPNFYQVDYALYRGGQPNQSGLNELKSLRIRTIVSLRGENEELFQEKAHVEALGMNFYNLPMSVYKKPSDEQILRFLEIVLNKENQPVFVHCESGRDRTGAIVAMYRVVVCGLTIKQAYKEAKALGFWPYRGEAKLKDFIHQLKDKEIYFKRAKELTHEEIN